jgi:hypothetical protein
MPTRASLEEALKDPHGKKITISADFFADICSRLRTDDIGGKAAAQALEEAAEIVEDAAAPERVIPEFGDEVQALPGSRFEGQNGVYYEPLDKGRVSKGAFFDGDGDECIKVTWFKSGKTNDELVKSWMTSMRIISKASSLELGDEVEALPGSRFEGQAGIYYEPGDRGRISSNKFIDNDGDECIKVTWYKSGRTNDEIYHSWMNSFRKVGRDEDNLANADHIETMEEAIKDQHVATGKPIELISGQPKSAAMGLFHFMRVKDPFAADSADQIEQEVRTFVNDIKDHSVLCELMSRVGDDPGMLEKVRGVYDVNHIALAQSEIAFYKMVARLPDDASPLEVATKVADETWGNLEYILHKPCSEKYVEGPNSIRDKGRNDGRGEENPMTLDDFMKASYVTDAELTKAHVVALRFYTTTAFKYLNSPLRSTGVFYDQKKPHPLPKTMAYMSEGIKKLRAAHAIKCEKGEAKAQLVLWRGMKNMKLPEDFLKNRKGGTELAPMSTTTNLSVAAKYASSDESVLFKIVLDNFMEFGADLSWLSAFPGEVEVLYPPLTFLHPSDREPQVVTLSGGQKFTIYEVKAIIP